MALSQRLDLRQSQSLVMTPQLQQAIKLLQLSNVELAAFVDEELQLNPMLERSEGEPGADRAESGSEPAEPTARDASERDSGELAAGPTLPEGGDSPLDVQYEDVWIDEGPGDAATAADHAGSEFDGFYAGLPSGGRRDFDDDLYDYESSLSRGPTLREHLCEQLQMDVVDPAERAVGMFLIDCLDECGWLAVPVESVAAQLGCDEALVQSVLAKLQGFDPSGIFAGSLKECFALQLRELDRLDPAMQALLDNLELLAKGDKAALLERCGVDGEDLADMVAEIRALDPKPGLNFEHEPIQTATPDILMRRHPDGDWVVELNPDTLPRVLVNTEYFARVNREARDKQTREYVSERFQSASWLVKSLDQRANTILRVASELVRQQDGFFTYGVQHLKPLILRDIAEAIEMHESTVSRVTTNKYIATPRGLFELKYFFTAAIPRVGGGDAHSAEAVRFRIKALIEHEPVASILSDDRIVEILHESGIDIARRTVAKYRESMKIPSSVERRRQKNRSL